jgi:hypothetical protein
MCWYDPPEESKKIVKQACKVIVNELKKMNEIGDPIGYKLSNVKQLLDHLWDPESCNEKK